jgi:hypothetical protein
MISSGRGKRFLVAAGTRTYRFDLPALPSVRDDITRVVDLLTASPYGYKRELKAVSDGPKAGMFRKRVRAWLNSPRRTSDDLVVFYYSGHGIISATGIYVLAANNTDPRNIDTAIPARFFVEALESSSVRSVLLVLDACFAGAAINDDMTKLAQNLTRSRGADDAPQIAILAAARREVAEEGAFARALCAAFRAVEDLAGEKHEYLYLDMIFDQINRIFRNTVSQRASFSYPGALTDLPAFFSNPKYKNKLPDGIDLETQSRIMRGDLEAHWGPRSRGVEIDAQKGWHFSGRRRALTKLIGWIERQEREDSILCVTGRPGTGKSAVLARLVTLSDPMYRQYVPLGREGSADSIPPAGLIDAAVHCLGKTASEVVGEISTLLDIKTDNVFDLASKIKDQRDPPVIVLDALDEAEEPDDILCNLQIVAAAGARVVVAVRSETVPLPGESEIVDLDDDEYIEVNDILNYVISL